MNPKLSILIPTYNYHIGVRNILSAFEKISVLDADVEIIVSDDSVNDEVEKEVTLNPFNFSFEVKFFRNKPSLGAIRNWNYLMELAHGDYIWLLHHDDCPHQIYNLENILSEIKDGSSPDCYFLRCLTFNVISKKMKVSSFQFIQSLFLKNFPAYILRRNVIGPPSCLIIKREISGKYDEKLSWLVDVEYFYRVILKRKKSFKFSELSVVSTTGLTSQITNLINGKIVEIRKKELQYLFEKYGGWYLKILSRRSLLSPFYFLGELIFWSVIKVFLIIFIFIANSNKFLKRY